MTEPKLNELKQHFRAWSGGFPPESECQITVYIEYAMQNGFDADDVREALREWMNGDNDDVYDAFQAWLKPDFK